MGLTFLLQTAYMLSLTVLTLAVAVGALGFRAQQRRGFGPALVGLAAAALIVFGKFVLNLETATYSGLALLIAASVWNAWPIRAARSEPVQIDFAEIRSQTQTRKES